MKAVTPPGIDFLSCSMNMAASKDASSGFSDLSLPSIRIVPKKLYSSYFASF